MNIQDLLDKISVLELDPAGEPLVPPPEVVAFFVRWYAACANGRKARWLILQMFRFPPLSEWSEVRK